MAIDDLATLREQLPVTKEFIHQDTRRNIPKVFTSLTLIVLASFISLQCAPKARTVVSADLRPGQTFRDCANCPEMVVVPAGGFTMGSPPSEQGRDDREGPERSVSIRQFAAGKFDVTRGQWAAFVLATKRVTSEGCYYSGLSKQNEAKASWRNLGFPQDDSHPVVCVTWNDTQDYLRWLSHQTGDNYRLLTESEWEYAARAGTTTPYPWGATASHEYANYGADSGLSPGLAPGRDRWLRTSPVGSFPPNAFGLYDMHGNVLQYVEDCFASSYSGLPADGSANKVVVDLKIEGRLSVLNGTSSCSYRMLRGGDYTNPPRRIRSAYRNFAPPPGATLQDYRSAGVGFRVAKTL
ncbi:MAG: formylglycine-generating enzyme family protein [Armatimonadota bacterium]|nr:formylglycine-generating enzyme family protein [Armatimonadota bacterium]